MRKLFLLFSVLLIALSVRSAIIQTPGTGNDAKFVVTISMTDSMGNVVAINPDYDSLQIAIIDGSDDWIYEAHMLLTDVRIKDTTMNGQSYVAFIDDLQDIDDDGNYGIYAYDIRFFDSTYLWWYPVKSGQFNATSFSLEAQLQGIADVLDSLQAQDDWIAHQTTSDSLYDSILSVLDSLENVLDSLENMESWVAQEASLPANFADLSITATTGLVAVNTISSTERSAIVQAFLDYDISGYTSQTNDPAGFYIKNAGDPNNYADLALWTYQNGSRWINVFNGECDTAIVIDGNGDTLGFQYYWHVGGSPGQASDSVKWEDWVAP